MKKKVVVSLGGSLIIPGEVNFDFLDKFKKAIEKNVRNCKFVIVCGGGSIARKYIQALEQEHENKKEISLAGIRATRMNAMFVMQFFGKKANHTLPRDMEEVRDLLEKEDIVVCGALRYAPNSTSDGTAAKLANFLRTDFINLTDVDGLYDFDPHKNKNAKLIQKESWKKFETRTRKIKFHAGQHFILDQSAAVLIRKHKITTYILGKKLNNLSNLLKGKKFVGTTISG